MAGNIITNPFAQARNDGPQFNDANKRSPTQQLQQPSQGGDSITNISQNDGFIPNDGNNNNNNNNNNTNNNNSGNDPMYEFDKLWDDTPEDPKNPKKEFKGYMPELDPAKFQEQLGKLDFSRAISPDIMKKVMAGGEEAAAAWPELINSIGRQTFSMAFNANSKMTKASLDNVESRFMNELIPQHINSNKIDDTVFSDNPAARDPKFAPMFKQVSQRMATKFPKASAQQINEAANKYMNDFVSANTPKPKEDDNAAKLRKGSGDADFEAWFNS